MGTRCACYTLIGARLHPGLSIGARLYLILVNNKLRICCLRALHRFMRLRPASAGLLVLARWRWKCVCIAPSHSCSLFGTATYHHRASVMTELGQGARYGPEETIQESVISVYVSYSVRKRTSRREKEGEFTPRFPMWRRKVKILHTKEGKRTDNWPSSPLAEPHITPQLGACAWLSSTFREFYRSEPRRGTNRPTKIHSFLMNCRAPVLGKQLLQTQGPRMRLATPPEPSLMSSLAAPPPPLTFRIRVIPLTFLLSHIHRWR